MPFRPLMRFSTKKLGVLILCVIGFVFLTFLLVIRKEDSSQLHPKQSHDNGFQKPFKESSYKIAVSDAEVDRVLDEMSRQ